MNPALNDNDKVNSKSSPKVKWTAVFAIATIMSKQIRMLIDIGASHFVIALSLLKYLNLEHLMKKTNKRMINAQKEPIPIKGKVTLPIEIGNKVFEWKFRVAEKLVCPMIMGMNVLHDATIKLKGQKLKING